MQHIETNAKTKNELVQTTMNWVKLDGARGKLVTSKNIKDAIVAQALWQLNETVIVHARLQ